MFVVDIYKEIIEPPFNVRACHAQTVQELKNMICQVKEIPDMSKMRCVLERCHSDFRSLVPNKTLKSEGFFKSNKVKTLVMLNWLAFLILSNIYLFIYFTYKFIYLFIYLFIDLLIYLLILQCTKHSYVTFRHTVTKNIP